MKKILGLLMLVSVLSGCKKNTKEINCVYEKEEDNKAKSYMHVTLVYNEDIILSEKLDATYTFSTKEEADSNYSKIEKVLEKDDTVILKQNDTSIAANGEKDVSSMKYDPMAKVAYYEELGYTCE